MSKRNRFIGIGIVFAIIALAISLMCIVFSYADINEKVDSENNLKSDYNGLNILIDTSSSTTQDYVINCSISGYGWSWNSNTNTLSNYSPGNVMRMSGTENNVLKIGDSHGGTPSVATITASYDPEQVIFEGFTGGVGPGQSITSDTTFIATFKAKKPPIEPTSACIKGSVNLTDQSTGASDAEVKLGNKHTGEVYGSAISNSDGSFAINNVDIDLAYKILDDEIYGYVYGSYPGYNIKTSSNDKWTVTQEDDVLIISGATLNLVKAIVNVAGAEHHQEFIIDMTRSTMNDSANASDSSLFALSSYGMAQSEFPSSGDVDFIISEDGAISANYIVSTSQVNVTSKNICDDGYTFDYIEFNGEKHYAGEIVTITPSALEEPINAQVHYKAIDQIAQTGDAIPYAVVIGLGVIAIVAFVISRKQLTKKI